MLLNTTELNLLLAQSAELTETVEPDKIESLDVAIAQIKNLIQIQNITTDMLFEYHKALDGIEERINRIAEIRARKNKHGR